jgi:hypothetical protein
MAPRSHLPLPDQSGPSARLLPGDAGLDDQSEPGGREGMDQLVYDGKNLRVSAMEAEDGSRRLADQVTVHARALGVSLAQATYDTGESS